MTRSLTVFTVASALALGACGGSSDEPRTPDPSTCAVYLWEPGDHEFETWPSMEYLVEDPSTATGYRFHVDPDEYPILARYRNHAKVVTEQLPTIDGFGINAAAWAEFSRPFEPLALPVSDGTAHVADPAGLLVLREGGEAELWPVEIKAIEDHRGDARLLHVLPLFPLPEKSDVVFFVTKGVESATVDGCVSPSTGARKALERPSERDAEAIAALVEIGAISGAEDLVVLQRFVTQSVYAESAAIAADIASRPDEDFTLEIDAENDCETFASVPTYRFCTATLRAVDYRDEAGHITMDESGAPVRRSEYDLYVQIWIPYDQGDGPLPLIFFGHGLNGDSRGHAGSVLRYVAAAGTDVVVVGVDAVEHGNHPDRRKDGNEPLFDFFAIEFGDGGPGVDSLRLRDNFRQSTFDKLQVTRAILANPDLDGDGTVDVDLDRMSYAGVSLGAIMGGELLALTDTFQAGMLSMPGGRVSAIVSDPESSFGALLPVLLGLNVGTNRLEVEKLFAVLQTALERGDAASFAARVLEDRIDPASTVPDVLVLVAIGDEIVPNAENYTFARAMGLEIVPPSRAPVTGLRTMDVEVSALVSGNVADGAATAGLIQFEMIETQGGSITHATHGNLTESKQAVEAILQFFRSNWDEGIASIVDPFQAVPLPD